MKHRGFALKWKLLHITTEGEDMREKGLEDRNCWFSQKKTKFYLSSTTFLAMVVQKM